MTLNDIEKVWVTDTAVWIRTNHGLEACEEYRNLPRLKWATQDQRERFEADFYGIHWPELDEDLSYEGFFLNRPKNKLYSIFIEHPELNASAIARRLGMSQSLLAQYISGTKKPSKEREALIMDEIHKIGAELLSMR